MITFNDMFECWEDESYFGTVYEFISKVPEYSSQSFENERDFLRWVTEPYNYDA